MLQPPSDDDKVAVVAKILVPINPEVLGWAIAESGLATAEVAERVGAAQAELEDWLEGRNMPPLTKCRKLAAILHRQLAVFLLPAPPTSERIEVSFRHPIGSKYERALTPEERRFLRRARRLQETESWLASQLEWERPALERVSIDNRAEEVAVRWRARMGVTIKSQKSWKAPSQAFDAWRAGVERAGVTVVQFSMGTDACRGFSIWDERSPLVAVNTAWQDEARIFTLFHEIGHLLTRTNSACATAPVAPQAGDPIERWCESFAAAVLIPAGALSDVSKVDSLSVLSREARRMKVSLRAMALRLITLKRAKWTLYQNIPPAADAKRRGGAGGTGRTRAEMRGDEFGRRTTDLFVTAVQRDVISESQALDFLDIPSGAFERLAAATPVG
jgi:Zn-dependent peptidase ImmA (M78 family)